MSKKLEGNGLWESSRMILPEHRVAMLDDNLYRKKKPRPELDEQKLEDINRSLQYSIQEKAEIELQLFGEFQDRTIRCIVTKIDQQLNQLKITYDDEWEWIKLVDIVEVYELY